ncbi:hypothetical protein [Synechococcus sp. CS-1328]|uniref:hypothetical protein n=1 Tax=Synechococcus sp. CS-1328 TaxID=2847976 RepID=UPI00223B6392|nr:hypothetical protein [Synechococcus sp. CS-1328]MCT0224746.1 hypothetical protein [Synechococcus sp. CS-1328]
MPEPESNPLPAMAISLREEPVPQLEQLLKREPDNWEARQTLDLIRSCDRLISDH